MDPRRILLRTDPGHPGITDLILRIPGAREVIIIGERSLELPGIRIVTQIEGEPPKLPLDSRQLWLSTIKKPASRSIIS